MREGNVFTGVCLFTPQGTPLPPGPGEDRGGTPGQGTSPVRSGGGTCPLGEQYASCVHVGGLSFF